MRLVNATRRSCLNSAGFARPVLRRRLSAADAFKSRTLLLHRFRSFPIMDPELSEGIDTVRDLRRQAVECFDEVYATLEPKAAEYFWETVEPRSPLRVELVAEPRRHSGLVGGSLTR